VPLAHLVQGVSEAFAWLVGLLPLPFPFFAGPGDLERLSSLRFLNFSNSAFSSAVMFLCENSHSASALEHSPRWYLNQGCAFLSPFGVWRLGALLPFS
jgi:hypothetical protein